MKSIPKPRVVILGGGFGGLEAGRQIRVRLPETSITLVSDRDYFLYKPNTIYVPFGMEPGKLMVKLAGPTRRENIRLLQAKVRDIDPVYKRVFVERREGPFTLEYDFLVIATGARMNPEEIPGLEGITGASWTPEAMLKLRTGLHRLVEDARAGIRRKVLFVISPYNRDSGPLYETIMALDTWLRRKRIRERVEIALSTYEERYLQTYGPGLHELVTSEFLAREITGYKGFSIDYVDHEAASYQNGEEIQFDLLIALPPYQAATRYSGLPSDRRGFISTELATRQVIGHPDVYAIGDAAQLPLKQALLAVTQASRAAEHISIRIAGTLPGFEKTRAAKGSSNGRTSLFAREPQRECAPIKEAAALTNRIGYYRSNMMPLWGFARHMVGAYIPWRFKAGNPFHEDAPWKELEMGLALGLRQIPDIQNLDGALTF